ncbi:hypothetical protein NE237_024149 [Protea cynaroides]|uniref:RING-type E3 ubiquitin transferase n=1 Tax=Protea cynaroides TaxID=273540 RepID=A0A9Q0HGE7_9MAGN|nr:hypothetical protein NE237_024149 [Protea cynaroides]
MDNQVEKVYVVVGNDLQEGLGTLDWALRKWSGQTIRFVIVHVDNTPRDYVSTPFGRLPASYVNDEKLEIIRMCEQEKINKLLCKYKGFCGKGKSEVIKFKKTEEPMDKAIVGFISSHQVTKLVMGITLMKSSLWKTKSAISGSFYIYRNKPNFCEVYIICGGKLVLLREENDEEYMEDESGVMIAKMREKGTRKGWFGKMFVDSKHDSQGRIYPRGFSPNGEVNTDSDSTHDWWDEYAPQVESYFQWLSSSKLVEEEDEDNEEDDSATRFSPIGAANVEHISQDYKGCPNRIESLKAKIEEARKIIEGKRNETKGYLEGQLTAQSIISVCNRRVIELEDRIDEEINKNQVELKNNLEAAREQIYEVTSDIDESKSRLRSLLELQSELATKLQSSSLAKSHVEAQLESSMAAKTEIQREVEELRRQRVLLHRRIEFCKEREAIAATNPNSLERDDLDYCYREFTADEIRSATDNFSDLMRLKKRADQMNLYRGRVSQMAVVFDLQASLTTMSVEEFRAKMELLSQIRHQHLVKMIGACPELKCIVFEYMHNGCLQNTLFWIQRNPNCNKMNNKSIHWHARIRIAAEVSMGLSFLHLFEPRPIKHGEFNLSNVLLDQNLVAKITVSQLSECLDESELRSDIYAFGVVMLQLLTGREEDDGLVEEVRRAMEGGALNRILDATDGEWPLDLATEFARIALRCASNMELTMSTVMKEVEDVRRKAAELRGKKGFEMVAVGSKHCEEDDGDVPSSFFCPILREVMKNPHVAADGFSYEFEAIRDWFESGHDTSPMTNLRLEHKLTMPNQTLRSLIQDWLNNRSTSP